MLIDIIIEVKLFIDAFTSQNQKNNARNIPALFFIEK
jgi:hypothetical protein